MSTFVDSKFLVCGGSTELTNAPNNTCDMFSLATMAWGKVEDMREYRHQVRDMWGVMTISTIILSSYLRLLEWVCWASST